MCLSRLKQDIKQLSSVRLSALGGGFLFALLYTLTLSVFIKLSIIFMDYTGMLEVLSEPLDSTGLEVIKYFLILMAGFGYWCALNVFINSLLNILFCSFNARLALKLEESDKGKVISFSTASYKLNVLLKRELIKFLYTTGMLVFALVLFTTLFFIPIINLAAPVVIYIILAWTQALNYLDYYKLGSNESFMSLVETQNKTFASRKATVKFGLSILLTNIIPVLNLFSNVLCLAKTKHQFNK